jgi:hypothetical protein
MAARCQVKDGLGEGIIWSSGVPYVVRVGGCLCPFDAAAHAEVLLRWTDHVPVPGDDVTRL